MLHDVLVTLKQNRIKQTVFYGHSSQQLQNIRDIK